jgi:hypothetical protein
VVELFNAINNLRVHQANERSIKFNEELSRRSLKLAEESWGRTKEKYEARIRELEYKLMISEKQILEIINKL